MKKEVFLPHCNALQPEKPKNTASITWENFEEDVDTVKAQEDVDTLKAQEDEQLADTRISTTADLLESSPGKTITYSQGYILSLSYKTEAKDTQETEADDDIDSVHKFRNLSSDFILGDKEQITLCDFGEEIMLVINITDSLTSESPVKTVLWLNKKDANKLDYWLRCWLRKHRSK